MSSSTLISRDNATPPLPLILLHIRQSVPYPQLTTTRPRLHIFFPANATNVSTTFLSWVFSFMFSSPLPKNHFRGARHAYDAVIDSF
jgi:hypothetical protein